MPVVGFGLPHDAAALDGIILAQRSCGDPDAFDQAVPGRLRRTLLQYIRAGTLRALAVTSATRSAMLPDTAIVADFVRGYEANGFNGVGAPKNTPAAVVDALNGKINAGLTDPGIKARFSDLGTTVTVGSPADFGNFIGDETEKWARVVRASNIKLD